MSDTLIIGLITGGISLLGVVVSLVSIFVSAKTTRDGVTQKLDTNQQLMEQELGHVKTEMSQMKTAIQSEISGMKADIRSHNNYAKLFNENIPVIKEKLSVANNRIKDIEDDVRFYHRKHED